MADKYQKILDLSTPPQEKCEEVEVADYPFYYYSQKVKNRENVEDDDEINWLACENLTMETFRAYLTEKFPNILNGTDGV